MKTLAIIAEYNPFHNGHLYHLQQAKQITNADYSIALMSGNFLQRGVPAMWDKYTRAKMCTSCGIDLALELPFAFATGSAMDFAMGAIHILNSLHSVDYLCFGAETADLNKLKSIAKVVVEEPEQYKHLIRNNLSIGMSYPGARENALTKYFNDSELTDIISQPNNILAIEYISALIRTHSSIEPIIIERKQAMYHDSTLYGSISSATAIREELSKYSCNTEVPDSICHDVPPSVMTTIESSYSHSSPVYIEDLTPFLQSKLISNCKYEEICDISVDFSNKLRVISPCITYEAAISSLATKDITKTRVCRNLIHLLLEYTENTRTAFIKNNYAFYANILSFKKDSSSLIKEINQNSNIPLITKKADFGTYLANYENIDKNLAEIMWTLDTKSTDLYNCLIYNKFGYTMNNDFTQNIPIT